MTRALRKTLSLLALLFSLHATAQDVPATADYLLGAGDDIRVVVFQNPDMTTEARVSESGMISFPLIGSVRIGGIPIVAAERKIATALKDGGFVRSPQVNIVMVQVRGNQVAVLGQVNNPGRFPLETLNTRVSDILAAAGGATATGDDSVILTGIRNGQPFRKVIDIPELFLGGNMDNDVVLAGGDTIYVSHAPVFYIFGEAQKPGPYRIERGMTIMQALSSGGGVTARGRDNRLFLHRKSASGEVRKTIPDLNDPVQPNDVIYVQGSFL